MEAKKISNNGIRKVSAFSVLFVLFLVAAFALAVALFVSAGANKEATATEAGSKHEECSVCGYKKAAVEIPATGTGTTPDQTKPGDSQGEATTPQTGDNSNMLLWIILCIAAAGALAGTFAYKKIRAERK